MRVHLPALLALVSAATYVACGSSDASKHVQGDGGAAGEGGASENAGGGKSVAGSSNNGGSVSGGEGGQVSLGGTPSAGSGGADNAESGAGGVIGGVGGEGGEGGAAPNPDDTSFSAACPGVVDDYTRLDGTANDDTFTGAQQVGKVLVFGLEGNDTFEDGSGADCLVGGLGEDDFSATGESSSYFVGGSDADTFHISGFSLSSIIVDMHAEDTIALSKTAYTDLTSDVGATPSETELVSVANYDAGTGVAPAGTGGVLVYDPGTGGLFVDFNRGTKGDGGSQNVATIVNHASYVFDRNDFVIE